MRPFTSTIPFADALAIVLDEARPIARTERLALADADRRVVSAGVTATADVPPFDRAAMDGYAVVADDTEGASNATPRALRCIGRAFSGQVTAAVVGRGECVEIATGAPLPPGADAVVMVEETERTGDQVLVRASVHVRQNVGRRGADITRGDVVVSAGDTLNPSRLGALAATGATSVDVFAKPTVALVSTGDEIVEPGRPLAPGQIYDVNRHTLEAVVRRHGGVAAPLAVTGDSLDALERALDRASGHDLIVFSGGSSVGDRDLVRDVIESRGRMLFHGIAVKPGKPTAFGLIDGVPVLGMPGYPTSCLSNAYLLLVPLLRRTARLPEWRPEVVRATLSRRVTSAPGRLQFYTVRLVDGRAEPAFKASGDITSMAHADGYFEIAPEVETVEAGTAVDVKRF